MEHTTDRDDLEGLDEPTIPDSWVDDSGIRHAVIWDLDQEVRYRLVNGKVLLEEAVF